MKVPDAKSEAARWYTEHGFAVFPIFPKHKFPRWLLEDGETIRATRDREVAKAWWQREPEANIGVATGHHSNCIVIDVDGKEGELALRALQAQYGELPHTARVKTGSGHHLYFQYEPNIRSTISKLARSIDVRGEDGYVVAPPSIHKTGVKYFWGNDRPLEKAPYWLTDLLRRSQSKTPSFFHGDRVGQ